MCVCVNVCMWDVWMDVCKGVYRCVYVNVCMWDVWVDAVRSV